MAMCFKSPFHPAHIPILTLLIHTTTVFFDLHLELQWRSWSLEDRFRFCFLFASFSFRRLFGRRCELGRIGVAVLQDFSGWV